MTASADSISVLHLLARPADYQTSRVLEALCRPGAIAGTMRREQIGPGGRWRNGLVAVLGLRQTMDNVDLVQCWDERALLLAAVAGARRLVFSPQQHPSSAMIRWLRAVSSYRDVHVIASSATAQRAFLRRGVPMERCSLVRPGVDFSLVQRRRDAALRGSLQIWSDDRVVLVPGESTDAANHRLSVWTMSILHVLDRRFRLLMWGEGKWADHAERLGGRMGYHGMVINAQKALGRKVPFESLIAASDLILSNPTGPVASLPTAVCMAAGLPIVTSPEPSIAEMLEDRHTCLMVPEAKPRLLADRMLTVTEDSALQWKISDSARAEAYEHWSLTKSLAAWRETYGTIAKA